MRRPKLIKPKKIEKAVIPKAASPAPKELALSKSDPLYYSKIGKISAKKRKLTSEDFSEMAKASHPRKPEGYRGGRKKKSPQ